MPLTCRDTSVSCLDNAQVICRANIWSKDVDIHEHSLIPQ